MLRLDCGQLPRVRQMNVQSCLRLVGVIDAADALHDRVPGAKERVVEEVEHCVRRL